MRKSVSTASEAQHPSDPFVSVIVASYNYEKYIRQNLDSIVNQTYRNFEVLVVDDGSTDSSMEIIAEFRQSDSRVKLLTHEGHANRGLSESVKLALSQARGTWIAFCESDDYWALNHLEEKVACASQYKAADVIVCRPHIFGAQEIVDKHNLGIRTLHELLRRLKSHDEFIFVC